MIFQPHELKLIAKLLELAGDKFSNHGCNVFDLVKDAGLSPEEAYKTNQAYSECNGDSDDWTEEDMRCSDFLGDYVLMHWLSAKIKEMVEERDRV
jgi:hypothetical protein